MANACPCVGELLATMVALEALEHNAVTSKLFMELGQDLKRQSPSVFEELSISYPLDYTIDEPLAVWGAASWLTEIDKKCGIDLEDVREQMVESQKLMRDKKPHQAAQLLTKAKMSVLEKSQKFCEGNSG